MKTEAPLECPVCSCAMRCSSEETEDNYPEWEYECGLILQRHESGKLHAEFVCQWATREAIDALNFKAERAATPKKPT